MVGNAWQWTQDCWHETYEGAPTDGSAWMTGSDCTRRAARGGAWRGDFRGLRTAGRGFDPADSRWATVGFRLARTLE